MCARGGRTPLPWARNVRRTRAQAQPPPPHPPREGRGCGLPAQASAILRSHSVSASDLGVQDVHVDRTPCCAVNVLLLVPVRLVCTTHPLGYSRGRAAWWPAVTGPPPSDGCESRPRLSPRTSPSAARPPAHVLGSLCPWSGVAGLLVSAVSPELFPHPPWPHGSPRTPRPLGGRLPPAWQHRHRSALPSASQPGTSAHAGPPLSVPQFSAAV